MITNRKFWRSTRGIITASAIAVALVGGVTAGVVVLTDDKAPTTQSAPQTSSAPSTDPSTGLQQYGANTPADYSKQSAVTARHEYPEYYQCRTYPSDANLTQADLVPTDNVVATITYNAKKRKYVVQGDPRITATEKDSVHGVDSDFKVPTPEQDFTFGFASGVHYFATYATRTDKPSVWSGAPILYGPLMVDGKAVPTFSLTLFTGDQKEWPQYVIIATDTSTCAAGTTSVPAGFDWKGLAGNGLLLPEFYTGGIHPQG